MSLPGTEAPEHDGSAMALEASVGEPGPSTTERRLAINAASSLTQDLEDALALARVGKARRPTYDSSSLHPLLLSESSLRTAHSSTRSSLAALKRSLISFDASVLSPALQSHEEQGTSKPAQRDPKLSKLFSLLRESADSAASTITAQQEVRSAMDALLPSSSKAGQYTRRRKRVYLPLPLLAPLAADAPEELAHRILSIIEMVGKSCGLVTLLEASANTLTLAGSIMVVDVETSPSTGAVTKIKFSHSVGGENGQAETKPDDLVEQRLMELVEKVVPPLQTDDSSARLRKEDALQEVLQELAAALGELMRLDGANEIRTDGEESSKTDRFTAMRGLVAEYEASLPTESPRPVDRLPSASTLALTLSCRRSPRVDQDLQVSLDSDSLGSVVISVDPTATGSYVALIDPALPCSRETATALCNAGVTARALDGLGVGPSGTRPSRLNGADAHVEVGLEQLLVRKEVGSLSTWRQSAFYRNYPDGATQVFHCPARPDALPAPAFLVSSVPFKSLSELQDIIKLVRSQAALNELFVSCFNDRTSAKPPTRDLFSPDAGFAKPVTLDSLLNGDAEEAVSIDVVVDAPSTISATFASPKLPACRAPLITLTVDVSDPDSLVTTLSYSSEPSDDGATVLSDKAKSAVAGVVDRVRDLPLAIKGVCRLLPVPSPSVSLVLEGSPAPADTTMAEAESKAEVEVEEAGPVPAPVMAKSVSATRSNRPTASRRKSSSIPVVVVPPHTGRRSSRPKIGRQDSGESSGGPGTAGRRTMSPTSPTPEDGDGKSREGSAAAGEEGEGQGVRRSKRARR